MQSKSKGYSSTCSRPVSVEELTQNTRPALQTRDDYFPADRHWIEIPIRSDLRLNSDLAALTGPAAKQISFDRISNLVYRRSKGVLQRSERYGTERNAVEVVREPTASSYKGNLFPEPTDYREEGKKVWESKGVDSISFGRATQKRNSSSTQQHLLETPIKWQSPVEIIRGQDRSSHLSFQFARLGAPPMNQFKLKPAKVVQGYY